MDIAIQEIVICFKRALWLGYSRLSMSRFQNYFCFPRNFTIPQSHIIASNYEVVLKWVVLSEHTWFPTSPPAHSILTLSPPCCSSNTQGTVLYQSLCISCIVWLCFSFPWYIGGSLTVTALFKMKITYFTRACPNHHFIYVPPYHFHLVYRYFFLFIQFYFCFVCF